MFGHRRKITAKMVALKLSGHEPEMGFEAIHCRDCFGMWPPDDLDDIQPCTQVFRRMVTGLDKS